MAKVVRMAKTTKTKTHPELTPEQWSILNCCSGNQIRQEIAAGKVPKDHPQVIERIAQRDKWENAANWKFGSWFWATYVNGMRNGVGRSGRVAVRQYYTPDKEELYHVVGPNGRWWDSQTREEAIKHLRSTRIGGKLVKLTTEEIKQAEYDLSLAMSR